MKDFKMSEIYKFIRYLAKFNKKEKSSFYDNLNEYFWFLLKPWIIFSFMLFVVFPGFLFFFLKKRKSKRSRQRVTDSVVVASTQAIPVLPTTTAVISSPSVPELVNPTTVPKFTGFSNQSGTEFSFNGSPVQFNNPFNETVSKRRVGKPIIQSTSAFDATD